MDNGQDSVTSPFNPENDFISPLSDFGFKNLFGKEGKAKQNLIVLLNAILHDRLGFEKIVRVSLNPTENTALNKARKSTRYDIYCTTDKNHHIIVEMQNRWEPNFDSRLLYYVSEAVTSQGVHKFRKGPWDYSLTPVVGLALCNFTLKGFESEPVAYFNLRDVKTNREYGKQFNLVYVHFKEFTQDPDKCHTELEKIVYSLRNMETMQKNRNNPFSKEKGDFYDTIMDMSRYSALTAEEQMEYVAMRLHENDQQLRELRAHDQGKVEGIMETARRMFQKGFSLEDISAITEIPVSTLKSSLQ